MMIPLVFFVIPFSALRLLNFVYDTRESYFKILGVKRHPNRVMFGTTIFQEHISNVRIDIEVRRESRGLDNEVRREL
ncbi:hypothetical protein H5410_059401 [Solanum commersonii]|uniref:Uncharacterized protein n=1 Tax=Solanum commersonii TaxID=4109 RepID=A0A9J5W296_SOLCO|nr:hypothetical protein H5410_059401 [Solanum commersonii]